MKKKLILLFFLFPFFATNAQTEKNQLEKTILKQIHQAYLGWNLSNCDYLIPENYMYEGDKIVGQYFIMPSKRMLKEKYYTITLKRDSTRKTITPILNDDYVFVLTYKNGSLTNIMSKTISNCDYSIKLDDNNNVVKLTANKKSYVGIKIHNISYSNNHIEKISHIFNKQGEIWINNTKEFSYKNDDVFIKQTKYTYGKPSLPENISKIYNCFTKKIDANKFLVKQGWGDTEEFTFDEKNRLTVKKISRNGNLKERSFFYRNDSIVKKETVIKNNNNFIKKEVNVIYINKNKDAPEYEKKVGRYTFNQKGDLIREEINGRYRNKTKAGWSNWRYFTY